MATYDRLARFYDRTFRWLDRLGLARWRAETLALLPSGGTLLEIGAGTGRNLKYYPGPKFAVASELSLEMLRRVADDDPAIARVEADAQALPFDENVFDAAFATLVFCSVPSPECGFAEAARVVKPGGSIVLLEHVRPPGALGHVFDLLNKLSMKLLDDRFNRETSRIAAGSGLTVIEVRRKMLGIVEIIVCRVDKPLP
jgi:ubiquinone/menaquinone biosynthesis C-methylase UbiE